MDSIMENNLKTFARGFMDQQRAYSDLTDEVYKLKKRIKVMQILVDYNLDVVDQASKIWAEDGAEKAMEYLEGEFIVGDDMQYEGMEKYDDEE